MTTETAYRLYALGTVIAGMASLTTHADRCHAEQQVDGATIAVDADEPLGAVLALIARRHGLTAVFVADDDRPTVPMDERRDPVYVMVLSSVAAAAAATGRHLTLTERTAITEQVYRDLREAGAIK